MSIKANFPDIKPSLMLDFANTKRLDPRITFTRATTATYYDGKTVAKAEENLFLYSQEFDNAAWSTSNATVTSNSTTAPDGTTTADTITSTSSTNPYISQAATYQSSAYVFSVFVKYIDVQWFRVRRPFNEDVSVWFDVQNGVVGTQASGLTGSIVDFGNGWYRCVITGTATAGSSSINLIPASADASVAEVIGSLYVWGAQLEQRDSVTAYTPTTDQPITNYIPVLQSAASGEARFDHDPVTGESKGLLIEEQRTNIMTYSEQFDNAAWAKTLVSVTANTVISPNGLLNGDLIESTLTLGRHKCQKGNVTPRDGNTYTYSVYVKKASSRYVGISSYVSAGSSNTSLASFDLDTGSVDSTGSLFVSGSANIESVGNGWFRISASVSAPSDSKDDPGIILLSDSISAGSSSYNFDTFQSVYAWGFQVELGAFPTSYIPTVASQVTRNADVATMTGTNFSSWFTNGAWSVYGELSFPGIVSTIANFSDDFNLAGSKGLFAGSSARLFLRSYPSGSTSVDGVINTAGGSYLPNVNHKVAAAFKTNDIALSLNGQSVQTDTSAVINTDLNSLAFGSANIVLKKLSVYPARLSNTELQGLTS
jgi:hypothetical protein